MSVSKPIGKNRDSLKRETFELKSKSIGRKTLLRLEIDEDSLENLPLWALNADYEFFKRKLTVALERKQNGAPAHKKYSSYEKNLQKRLAQIDAEIERRKENGS